MGFMEGDKRLTKVGIFYDGNYFAHVSNYYNYVGHVHKKFSIYSYKATVLLI